MSVSVGCCHAQLAVGKRDGGSGSALSLHEGTCTRLAARRVPCLPAAQITLPPSSGAPAAERPVPRRVLPALKVRSGQPGWAGGVEAAGACRSMAIWPLRAGLPLPAAPWDPCGSARGRCAPSGRSTDPTPAVGSGWPGVGQVPLPRASEPARCRLPPPPRKYGCARQQHRPPYCLPPTPPPTSPPPPPPLAPAA